MAILVAPLAQAEAFERAASRQLTPRLEWAQSLIERRFDLVLKRHELAISKRATRCQAGTRSACRLQDWLGFLEGLEGEREADQVYRVHRYINDASYVTDQRNWRRQDYWAVPEQLFERGGDCEDYVIAKYLSLRQLGIAPERLRLVVVYDRRRRQDHAVLAVLGPSETLVLDNDHQRVLTWKGMRERYKPYYSLNENSVWVYDAGV